MITRQWLRENRACYTDNRIAGLVPADGLTPLQVLNLDIPAADRVWVLTRPGVLTREQVVAFARGCAGRAKESAADAEREKQITHLRELIGGVS